MIDKVKITIISACRVTYILTSAETIECEFGAPEQIPDNFPKYVVSMDELDMSRNGIKHCNIRKFLTMEEWAWAINNLKHRNAAVRIWTAAFLYADLWKSICQ